MPHFDRQIQAALQRLEKLQQDTYNSSPTAAADRLTEALEELTLEAVLKAPSAVKKPTRYKLNTENTATSEL